MKRATTVADVRREYKRASADPVKLQRLMQRWAREALPRKLEQWQNILMATGDDGITRIARAGEIVARFEWDDLRKSLAPEHYELVALLYRLLQEQAAFALSVQNVLLAETAAIKGRSTAGTKTGGARAWAARAREAKILAEARAIRQTKPGIKPKALAATLHERGLGGIESLKKKLRTRKN